MTLPSMLHCVVSLSPWIITLHKIHRQLRRLSNYSKVKVATFWRMVFFGSLHIPTILKCCSESMLRRIHNKVLRRAVINYETTHKWTLNQMAVPNYDYSQEQRSLLKTHACIVTEYCLVAHRISTMPGSSCLCHVYHCLWMVHMSSCSWYRN